MNNVVLVGRLTKDPELMDTDNGNKRAYIVLAVPRNYKNAEGNYETDFVSCILWNKVAEHTCEYCKKGDVLGLKARIQSSSYDKDGVTMYSTDIIAERVSFLSSVKKEKEDEIDSMD